MEITFLKIARSGKPLPVERIGQGTQTRLTVKKLRLRRALHLRRGLECYFCSVRRYATTVLI